MWLDRKTAVIGRGLRTNQAGIEQITTLIGEMGITCLAFDLPYDCMHFIGMLRLVDRNLAFIRPRRISHALVDLLRDGGFKVLPLPDLSKAIDNMAFNLVVMGPGKIMLPAKNPRSIAAY